MRYGLFLTPKTWSNLFGRDGVFIVRDEKVLYGFIIILPYKEIVMSGDHRDTSNYKKEILTNLNFMQYRNTTIYSQKDIFILSPSVAKNQQGYYWFDIREKILSQFDPKIYKTFHCIIRIVDVGFLSFPFQKIQKIMTKESKIEKPSKNKVWSFKIQNDFSIIVNRKSVNDKISVIVKSENEIVENLQKFKTIRINQMKNDE